MDKIAQLNHKIQHLSRQVVQRGKLQDQVKLDAAIAEYEKLIDLKQKEEDEVKAIVEELKRESIFERNHGDN